MSKKNNSKTPTAVEFTGIVGASKKIVYGTAVIPFDDKQGCWVLPAGINQIDRRVWTAGRALAYAKVIDKIIRAWLLHIRTAQRGDV